MFRFGILSSVVPLVLVGGVAHDWTAEPTRQCFEAGHVAAPSRAIAFTSDPLAATVNVQIVDRPELADLAIADDVEESGGRGCGIQDIARLVAISSHARPGEPIVHLTRDADADADYRIYVDSARISPQRAAALIVGARGGHTRLASRPIDDETTGSIPR